MADLKHAKREKEMSASEGKQPTTVQKALRDIETAWNEMKTTPVNMSVDKFEKELLRQAAHHGIPYSTEAGKWLATAKRVLKDPRISQGYKNLYLSEVDPPELKPATTRFYKAFARLEIFAEWSYTDLMKFLQNPSKDAHLKAFLRWRALPAAEAFHKYYGKQLKGRESKEFYLSMRPAVVFRKK